MEDLANAFKEDFLEAVKVLEDFSSSDGALREAMRGVRERIAAKMYTCAPNFWDDLRKTLGDIEQQRDDRASKSKAQQVLKQIARLEVKFWAKESVGMLRELDPESRLERMRDWILTFDASDSGDQSSGPAVLYQVLNDINLQKDLEPQQRDALLVAVRENLHKFPVEMQAVLERVGSLQGGVGARVYSDWRRRNQPSAPEQAAPGGTRLSFVPTPKVPAALSGPAGATEAGEAPAAGLGAGPAEGGVAAPTTSEGVMASTEEPEEREGEGGVAEVPEPFDLASVEPAALERARRAVLEMLKVNGGECQKHYVRALLRGQAGVEGLPIAALGEGIFFSATEVFVRAPTATPAIPAQPVKSPVPVELQRQMLAAVREAGGRLTLSQMMEALQWHPGSVRHAMHGALRRAVEQVPELFFEPKRVFTAERARQLVAVLGDGREEPTEEPADQPVSAPYVADPFAELISAVLTWLEREDGVLEQEAVLPLVKALGFRVRAVISALAHSVFWSHPEAECEILLRTSAGAAQHPRPLPKVYLHEQVHQKLLAQVRSMGPKAKLDRLAGVLGWNARSELKKAYGTLRVVLTGLREIFFDPTKLYLKRSLSGLVDWPVNKDGRLGPQASEDLPVQFWTQAADDPKAAGDPVWLGVKRQILGMLLRRGGMCEVAVLRQLLQPMEGVELEELLQPGSAHDLSELLFWSKDVVYCRRTEAIEAPAPGEDHLPIETRLAIVDTVRRLGPLPLAELRAAVDAGGGTDANALVSALPHVPELLFAPEHVLLRRVAEATAILRPQAPATSPGQELEDDAAMQGPAQPSSSANPAEAGDSAEVRSSDTSPAAPPQVETGRRFFSFNEFTPTQEAPAPVEQPPSKRPRLEGAASAVSASGPTNTADAAVWTSEVPPWATQGAAVTVREENLEGIILRVSGASCTVRLVGEGGDAAPVERDFAMPALLPASPRVGAAVRVIGGDRSGCQGTLVGLAGMDGVVQIGKMSYETLPMSQLVVLAT